MSKTVADQFQLVSYANSLSRYLVMCKSHRSQLTQEYLDMWQELQIVTSGIHKPYLKYLDDYARKTNSHPAKTMNEPGEVIHV